MESPQSRRRQPTDIAQRHFDDAIARLANLADLDTTEVSTLPPKVAIRLIQRLDEAEATARRARQDVLTGVLGRGAAEEALCREQQRSTRTGTRISIIFADIDGLKDINDRYGHRAGDTVLAEFGRALRSLLRPYDIAGRWGGDEFVVALLDCDLDRAHAVAARVESEFGAACRASVTCGCVEVGAGEDLPTAVARADAEMYLRKRGDPAAEAPRPP